MADVATAAPESDSIWCWKKEVISLYFCTHMWFEDDDDDDEKRHYNEQECIACMYIHFTQ